MFKKHQKKSKRKHRFSPEPLTPQQEALNRKILQHYNGFAERKAASMGFPPRTGTECLWGVLMDFKAGRSDKDGFLWFEQMVNKLNCDPEDLAKLYESIHSKLAFYDQLMDRECKRLGI